MDNVLLVCLAVVLAFLAYRLARETRRYRSLTAALEGRNLHLPEETRFGEPVSAWDRVSAAANQLIEDNRRLEGERSGQLSQLEAVLDNLREAVLIVDGGNVVVAANRSLREMLPASEAVIGQRVARLLPNGSFVSYVEDVRRGADAVRREFQFEFPGTADPVFLRVSGTRIRPLRGEGQWLLFILDNVTRERRLEGIQKDFVANVSHELRTPISVIRGYIETLVEDHGKLDAAEQLRFLQAIQRHTMRLGSLVEDLLTISRLDSKYPGLQVEQVDLHALVAQQVGDYQARCERSGHHLEVNLGTGPVIVSGDSLKLGQVVDNLVDNAIKYTPKGARIEVKLETGDTGPHLCVADDGPGIPEKDQPRIFERFYRVEKGRSREKGGTGLGLSIVHDIVQLHGGRVWVESAVGRGARFHVALPFPSAQRERPAGAPVSAGVGGG